MLFDDLNPKIPLIYLVGQEKLKILNYVKVLKYEQTQIIVLLIQKKLYVKGNHLNIEYFNEDELYIHGSIQSIVFQSS